MNKEIEYFKKALGNGRNPLAVTDALCYSQGHSDLDQDTCNLIADFLWVKPNITWSEIEEIKAILER